MLTQEQLIDVLHEAAPDDCKNAGPGQVEEAARAALNPSHASTDGPKARSFSFNPLASLAALARQTNETVVALTQRLGRRPSAQEVAAELQRQGKSTDLRIIGALLAKLA